MPRVIGIDPGTVSIDVCGLDDGRLFLARSVPTADVPAHPARRGGAFPAAVAVAGGRIVDGAGGSAGALGFRARGALDGEVAYLAGTVSKALLFRGGATTVAGWKEGSEPVERLAHPATPQERVASEAFIESAVKTAVALALSVPGPAEFVLS